MPRSVSEAELRGAEGRLSIHFRDWRFGRWLRLTQHIHGDISGCDLTQGYIDENAAYYST